MARHFYENDDRVITTPGYNQEIPADLKEQESSHGNISFVDGMGVRSTPYLEKQANAVRTYFLGFLSIIGAELGTQKTAVINEWNTLKAEVDSVVVDPVFPQVANVIAPILVSAVAVSRSNLAVRFAVTSAVGAFATRHYMPRTFNNVVSTIAETEEKNFPELYRLQNELLQSTKSLSVELGKYVDVAEIDLQRQIHEARAYIAKILD